MRPRIVRGVTPMSKPLSDRINALETLVNVTQGRIDPADHRAASALLATAGKRLSFVGDHTVVALAGATGSGKSSLFNALSQTTLAIPGVIRPTTSKPMACVWGETLPDELLDWLDVSTRHLIAGGHHHLDGLVLMDLPDHDSTEVSHRLTVDRLVTMVDMLVWVVDPQKYADAALQIPFNRTS